MVIREPAIGTNKRMMTMSNTMSHCRLYQRVDAQLPVTVLLGQGPVSCIATDVSFSGLFLTCDTLLRPRSIIKLSIDVGDGKGPLQLLAMVARVLDPCGSEPGMRRGMGCSFYGNSRLEMHRWEQFVQNILAGANDSSPLTNAANHLLAEVPINIDSVVGLTNLVDEHQRFGHFFITCDRVLPQGAPVRLVFEFSKKNERFIMVARVVGTKQRDGAIAMAVEPIEEHEVLSPRVKEFLDTMREFERQTRHGQLIQVHQNEQGIETSIPILGDTDGIVFTGLVTEELVLVEDFMDDLFGEIC